MKIRVNPEKNEKRPSLREINVPGTKLLLTTVHIQGAVYTMQSLAFTVHYHSYQRRILLSFLCSHMRHIGLWLIHPRVQRPFTTALLS